MNEEFDGLTRTQLKEVFVNFLSDKMSKADWHYDYSDDPRVWRIGNYEIGEIDSDLRLLAKLDGGLEEAKELWKQHVPPYTINEATFFSNPGELKGPLGGIVLERDMPELQKVLDKFQEIGDRFVAFPNDQWIMPNDRFVGFCNATEAHSFAFESGSPEINYKVCSISELQKDLNCALKPEADKEQTVQKILEKLSGEGKSRHSQELSR
ncbi:hypothetical protein [Niabella beijingensis]|uniref:hypothetical protein n=1 Tax=Niabella beijingensis TaxID=2872700 RepID=UPI001CC17586|nr:hypothetical protein [Niabella beijingensis]MBZ4187607.1 hypothetical protein [Niabella beijingensis]